VNDRVPSATAAAHALPDESAEPGVSIVIPVHNEARILRIELERIVASCRPAASRFEVIVCENGSTDDTWSELQEAQRAFGSEVRAVRLPAADYGFALRRGIALCRYQAVVIFNIDFWDAEFLREALMSLSSWDGVIASKTMLGSKDTRPLPRRAITRGFNGFLRLVFGFQGTDTHGLKALRRGAFAKISHLCITNGDIFDTELVLRAHRRGLKIVEVPIRVAEIRQPSYRSLWRRVPTTVWSLVRLYAALRESTE